MAVKHITSTPISWFSSTYNVYCGRSNLGALSFILTVFTLTLTVLDRGGAPMSEQVTSTTTFLSIMAVVIKVPFSKMEKSFLALSLKLVIEKTVDPFPRKSGSVHVNIYTTVDGPSVSNTKTGSGFSGTIEGSLSF